jgi:hypothetical protein
MTSEEKRCKHSIDGHYLGIYCLLCKLKEEMCDGEVSQNFIEEECSDFEPKEQPKPSDKSEGFEEIIKECLSEIMTMDKELNSQSYGCDHYNTPTCNLDCPELQQNSTSHDCPVYWFDKAMKTIRTDERTKTIDKVEKIIDKLTYLGADGERKLWERQLLQIIQSLKEGK